MALVCGALPLAPFVRARRSAPTSCRGCGPSTGRRGRASARGWWRRRASAGSSPRRRSCRRWRTCRTRRARSASTTRSPRRYAWPSASYLGVLVAPDLFGGAERGQWFGAFNHWEMAGWYAGALTVLLAPFGLAAAAAGAVGARRRGAARHPAGVRRRHAGASLLLPLRAALRRAALPDARAGDGSVRAADPGRRRARLAVVARRRAAHRRHRRGGRVRRRRRGHGGAAARATGALAPPMRGDAPRLRPPRARRRRGGGAGGAARSAASCVRRRRAFALALVSLVRPGVDRAARYVQPKPRRLGGRHRALRRRRLAAGAASDATASSPTGAARSACTTSA